MTKKSLTPLQAPDLKLKAAKLFKLLKKLLNRDDNPKKEIGDGLPNSKKIMLKHIRKGKANGHLVVDGEHVVLVASL